MNRVFILKIIAVFLTSFFSISTFAISNENKSVDKVLQKYIHAYETRNLNTLAQLYSLKATAIGTGSDEILHGRDKIIAGFKRDFEQSTKARISSKKIALNVQGNSAIASYYIMVNVKIPNSTPFQSKLRFTLGLLKENNHWVIVQSHLSAPLLSQKENESFPAMKS